MPQPLVDRSCCYSFDDLFVAVNGRVMSEVERRALYDLPQQQRNEWVRQMAARTMGRFACQDRQGTDGVTYTAFWAVQG